MRTSDRYAAILAEDPVVAYAGKKFGVTKSPPQQLLSDPYYRFFRIIDLLTDLGITPTARDTWLDVGCHVGQFLAVFSHLHEANWIGVDDWDLKAAMPFAKFGYQKVNLESLDWTSCVPPHSVRFVSALEVIEHMTDTDAFLESIKAITLPDAYLILSTPNINSLRNRVLVPFGVYPAYLEYRNIIHHVRLFNVDVLKTLLQSHGFAMRACIGVNFLRERWLGIRPLRWLSEKLGDRLPQLCGDLIVVARRTA